ncbi:hypothetical protein AYI68_g5358 [Smittium mucronatum]|uniref:Uncharacterized protein n=1 Tax=Smittium mucronatum TaxID=133383 RepID=A0A1R0GUG9_9FUNG|nr:hypothetical protein AYI68_g5358 [Smittium mucronatum]
MWNVPFIIGSDNVNYTKDRVNQHSANNIPHDGYWQLLYVVLMYSHDIVKIGPFFISQLCGKSPTAHVWVFDSVLPSSISDAKASQCTLKTHSCHCQQIP